MARIGSQQIGGYYETPPAVCAEIVRVLSVGDGTLNIVDPCAGDGAAITQIGEALIGDRHRYYLRLFACELEATRARALKTNVGGNNVLHGDAFHVSFSPASAGMLYLNPPYDTDRETKRLEHRFLVRFTSVLGLGGVLVFVVPYYALSASIEFLATHYDIEAVVRFPGAMFDSFKQVVVFARRTGKRIAPDSNQAALVSKWAVDGADAPSITDAPSGVVSVPSCLGGPSEWRMRAFDINGIVRKATAWVRTNRGKLEPTPGSEIDLRHALLRTFPVATAPRPAHIAAGIASGIFNGARITPDIKSHKGVKLPDLLVKGVFDREYRTVEEKHDRKGRKVGEIQVQQPKLVVTVLDLSAKRYATLDEDGIGKLLENYGRSLGRVMAEQCPADYDPTRDAGSIVLHTSPRKLYTAQAHASRALVKLLRGRDRTGILLGEIGCGKTTVSLTSARSVGAQRILVVCPPHLLQSWRNECATIAPDMTTVVLETPQDVDRVAAMTGSFVAILSRETAKLGHGWGGVNPAFGCPRCGAALPADVDFAKKRMVCGAHERTPVGAVALAAERVAAWLDGVAPSSAIRALRSGRAAAAQRTRRPGSRSYRGMPRRFLGGAIVALVEAYSEYRSKSQEIARALFDTCFLASMPSWTVMAAAALLHNGYRSLGFSLLLTLPTNHPAHVWVDAFKRPNTFSFSYGDHEHDVYTKQCEAMARGDVVEPHTLHGRRLCSENGVLLVDNDGPGDIGAAVRCLDGLASLGVWEASEEECGEPLYQATPTPRRAALGKYITRFHAEAFDFLILDEAHEYSSEDAAQTIAAHRLAQLDVPKILMTGSIMNGYAESMFANMWSTSHYFREEFQRDERARFVDTYGYKKRFVEERVNGDAVEWGSHSERVVRSERTVGCAPGVLPLFILRHLLRCSVTLHKADLALDLPPCNIIPHKVKPAPDVLKTYTRLQDALVSQIRSDMFNAELSGKLFGQLAELPSYLDRATRDVGNTAEGDFVIRYPESVGGAVIACEAGLPVERTLTKEIWALDTVKSELAQGRNVMIFSWHVSLLPRLARLVGDLGVKTEILYADKVAPSKRQDWIDRKVVRPGVRVLLCNPVAIQTGLNNLVHFASVVWMENPACNPIVYRQAIGRIDRIGQRAETRVYFPIYADTLQAQLYDLLLHKVAVSTATDGLDPESALLAAGLGDDAYMSGLSIGKQIWAMIENSQEGRGGKPRANGGRQRR